jgi:response regulator NasT
MAVNTILISEKSESNELLEKALSDHDYKLIFNGSNMQDLLHVDGLTDPQLIVINIDKPDSSLIQQLRVINQQYPLPIVIFTQDSRDDAIEHAIQAGVSAYVVDGLNENRILPILRTAQMRFKQNQSVQAELNNLRTTLADRKVIDRAKGMIMAQRACTEDEAYKLLRTTAMNQNIRLAALAQNIIDAAQLLDPKVG